MIKTISYINIILSFTYLILYLLNSYSYAMLGIVLEIILCLLIINTINNEKPFQKVHLALSIICFCFAMLLSTWAINIISSSIAYNYFGNSWLYLFITISYAILILVQTIIVWFYKSG